MRRIFYQTHIFSKKLDSRGGPALLLRIEEEILKNPEVGATVAGTGGVRKLRKEDPDRKKGKTRWMLGTFYGKDEADDFSAEAKKLISQIVVAIKAEE